jgi:hypothetical protein
MPHWLQAGTKEILSDYELSQSSAIRENAQENEFIQPHLVC